MSKRQSKARARARARNTTQGRAIWMMKNPVMTEGPGNKGTDNDDKINDKMALMTNQR